MAIETLPPRNFAFIVSEAAGTRSRATLPCGNGSNAITAGSILVDNSGTYEEAAVSSTTVAGILCESVSDSDTDVSRTVIVRDAEVSSAELQFPTGASAAQVTALTTALADIGIIVR